MFLTGWSITACRRCAWWGLTVLCYAALWLVERVLRRRAPVQHSFTVTVYREGQAATLPCLYDSGNHLTEPFSGRPVLVAERAALAALGQLPQGAEQLSRAGPRLAADPL